jgi:NADPH-dependent 2,4-dienoyl-CoA reductase/sulfur reductase-like enzyme/rhodanese-related sulfurtransferase
MPLKIVVVGGVAGGMSVAARSRRLDEHDEIVVLERGRDVSFSNCALPFHLSGVVQNSRDLVLMHPEQFRSQYAIDVRTRHEVVRIDREAKTVTVRRLDTGEEYEEGYDKLALSPGARAVVPPVPGIDSEHVYTVRNVQDIERLQARVTEAGVQDVVVVGGGYIGLEVAENLRIAGRSVTLVERQDHVMARIDSDLAQLVHRELHDKGVRVRVGTGVTEVRADGVSLSDGEVVAAQAVVMCVGVRPETELAAAAGLELGTTGGIKVDAAYRTSDPDIYAVGDAVEVHHRILGKPVLLSMAGPAQRQARAAADHMHGRTGRRTGVIGSAVVRVFDQTIASTGLNEDECLREGLSFEAVYVIGQDKVGLMPGSMPIHLKVLFEVPTGRVLGAQAVGPGNVEKRIDVIATLLMMNGTLEDMRDLELCYSPWYGTAKDVVNQAALVGLNILSSEFDQVLVSDLRRLVEEEGAFVIDVREPHEYERGHVVGAVNIPMSQFRDRLDEIPADRPVYCHCRIGQRSYNVTRALNQLGFPRAINVAGSFLGLSNQEFFADQTTGRTPLVTDYNFA